MEEKKQKMVPKYHYDQMEKSTRLRLRDEFLRRSGMSLITFYDKLRKDSFKPLERELYENIFIIQQNLILKEYPSVVIPMRILSFSR